MKKKIYVTRSAEETMRLAEKLAHSLKAGDCLALMGELGSGKTTFVKGLAYGLGFKKKDYVSSPTFVILKTYPARIPIYHFDVYRLSTLDEFQGIGLEEFIGSQGICVIEWADKLEGLLPPDHMRVEFSTAGSGDRLRKIVVHHLSKRRGKRKSP
ncbi:tRNA (adenosine(37)-N6)-threonylcarbamoyltransferase complex ATPase subunit type 1 TsaE [Candidatus Velamenicoccus archaeovorus]|uniref:tRNA threonylcarbamoyladenosine biosynthesis protein TsaE n=1 Tax=Velamenicoccus archaeovorus TaxID=1930593 RepID=A0A410P568_VELA1|nr:tRNA (adenosine(37)-N6)-threonylcarbamoyltransferase complex ATPase subunit type 1 TsaE [Candidatus Velamenicoccus archaeovorus]QAT17329.1 tRNA (adenosine(37)-N6)-threonylcarbamoyltransferase complex ATPase subunit type 1 TsaE [Candidatus Velamenicoccus archaeovorus]